MPTVLFRGAPRRSAATFAASVLAIALLAGCTPTPASTEDLTGPNPSGDPTGQPAPTLTAEPAGDPIDLDCADLVSAETVYAFNPNFTAIANFTPATGSVAESALEYQGLACRWQNQTSGVNIDLSVASLDDDSLTALKNAAFADSEMVPTYGEEAYFSVEDNGVGTAVIFQGTYWIVAESQAFFEPGDAAEIIQSVLSGLA